MPLFFLALGLLLRDEGKFLVHALTAFGVVIVAVYVVFTRRAYLGREERTERESLGTA